MNLKTCDRLPAWLAIQFAETGSKPIASASAFACRILTRYAVVACVVFGGMLTLADLPRALAQVEIGEPRQLSTDELRDGWISLFDGESLYGWRNESTANWRVEDSSIVADDGTQPGLLCTTTQFDNYRLSVDFLGSASTNSGIFLRTSPRPKDPTGDCIELNIAPRSLSPFPTGSLVGRKAADEEFELDTWHRFEVEVRPGRVIVLVDGEQVLEHETQVPTGRGFVGLQFNQGDIRFRNLFLKPLEMKSLFNGKSLEGWRTHPHLKTRSEVTEAGELKLSGGRGQIETVGAYDDFILQLESRTLVPETNSGVFLRCIPTEEMNGYEVQINHTVIDQDPSRPADCGTGGIFRRQDARRVNARDDEWFAMTIVAMGPHFSVWVNGLQVSDWHDERRKDPNPRRGLRTSAGTIMLQGHDPESVVLFRNLQIAEHANRRR